MEWVHWDRALRRATEARLAHELAKPSREPMRGWSRRRPD
jgi:hypothetical protein